MKKRILASSLVFAILFITACAETPQQQAMRSAAASSLVAYAAAAELARVEYLFDNRNETNVPFDRIKNNINSMDYVDCDGATMSFNSEGKLVIEGTCKVGRFSCTYAYTEGATCK